MKNINTKHEIATENMINNNDTEYKRRQCAMNMITKGKELTFEDETQDKDVLKSNCMLIGIVKEC